MNEIKEALNVIKEVCDYILHPLNIFSTLWDWLLGVSYVLCLAFGLTSLLLYLFGCKKFAKYVPVSIGIYVIIQAIGVMLSEK
jgi:hypothetical protein